MNADEPVNVTVVLVILNGERFIRRFTAIDSHSDSLQSSHMKSRVKDSTVIIGESKWAKQQKKI